MVKSSKKIVKCKICEKNITTQSQGKKFRHCGTDQFIKDCLIADLSTETPKKAPAKEKEKKPETPEKQEESQSKPDEKNGKEKPKPDREDEDDDDWGF